MYKFDTKKCTPIYAVHFSISKGKNAHNAVLHKTFTHGKFQPLIYIHYEII